MEEQEFKTTYRELNTRPCVFEKAVLAGCGRCPHAQRLYLAEREGVACSSESSHRDCSELLRLLHPKAAFTLRMRRVDGPLPHGKELKVQCGAIDGLAALLAAPAVPGDAPSLQTPTSGDILEIHPTLRAAIDRFGTLGELPYQEIVKGIARYQVRRRSHAAPRPRR